MTTSDKRYTRRCYKFPPRLVERLRRESARTELSTAEIVRRALDAYFDNLPDTSPR